jgi:hypothetical protein
MHSPSQDSIELFAARRDFKNAFSLLAKFVCGLKAASCRLHGRQ